MTTTVCVPLSVAGAVYNPPVLMVPIDGLMSQVTPVFVALVIVVMNCWVCPIVSVTVGREGDGQRRLQCNGCGGAFRGVHLTGLR